MTTVYDYESDEPEPYEIGGKEVGLTGKWSVELEFDEDGDGIQDIWVSEIQSEEIIAEDEDGNKYEIEDTGEAQDYRERVFDRLKESFERDYCGNNLLYEVRT